MSILSKLKSDGFVEIGNFDAAISTEQFTRRICAAIGAVGSDKAEYLVASPKGLKPFNTYGGNYGYGELPLHTDLAHWFRPPRYLILRCLCANHQVATHIFSRLQLESLIPLSLMEKALFSPRRRLDGKLFLLRMVEGDLLRWDQLFLKPQNIAARKVVDRMQEITSELPKIAVVLAEPGQALLIDNWAALHGRGAIPVTRVERKIERIYLESN